MPIGTICTHINLCAKLSRTCKNVACSLQIISFCLYTKSARRARLHTATLKTCYISITQIISICAHTAPLSIFAHTAHGRQILAKFCNLKTTYNARNYVGCFLLCAKVQKVQSKFIPCALAQSLSHSANACALLECINKSNLLRRLLLIQSIGIKNALCVSLLIPCALCAFL